MLSDPSREHAYEYEMFVAFMVVCHKRQAFRLLSGLLLAIFLLPLLYVAGLALLLAIDILRALIQLLVCFLVAVLAINRLSLIVDLVLVWHIGSPYDLDNLYWFFLSFCPYIDVASGSRCFPIPGSSSRIAELLFADFDFVRESRRTRMSESRMSGTSHMVHN
jgi:hypothetical protein